MVELWAEMQDTLREKIGSQGYEIWIRPIRARTIGPDRILLLVPNRYYRDWVQNNYGVTLCKELTDAHRRPVTVEFDIADAASEQAAPDHSSASSASTRGTDAGVADTRSTPLHDASLSKAAAPPSAATTRARPAGSRSNRDPEIPPAAARSSKRSAHRNDTPRAGEISAGDPPPSTEDRAQWTRSGGEPATDSKTFNNFVVGASNQFAHACSLAVSETPNATGYNPLFIYGGTGLGKTHLLQAIGHQVQALHPDSVIHYTTAESFTNTLIESLRYGKMEEFRHEFRDKPTILLMDDVQFVGGKDRTQEELFHTFEYLMKRGAQIVFAADVLPREIDGFEPRLRTRCESGMLADMQAPDLETLAAILHQKADDIGMTVPADLAQYIGSRVRGSIRELEGVLHRLNALCKMYNVEPSVDFARQHLADVLAEEIHKPNADEIIKTVAGFYNINVSDLKGTRRLKQIVRPRHVAMYLVRHHCEHSFPEIGRIFGRDHATVQHACKKIRGQLVRDVDLKNAVEALTRNLGL